MNDKVTVKGTADGSFTSYWDKDKHGQMSETIDGTTDDDLGEQLTEILPNDVDPEGLTDKQRTVLEEAVSNPYQTASDIDDKIGSKNYSYQILTEQAPEFYENVFKQRGGSKKSPHSNTEVDSDESDSDGPSGEDIVDNIKSNIEPQTDAEGKAKTIPEGLETALNAIEATAQTEETKQAIEHIRGLL